MMANVFLPVDLILISFANSETISKFGSGLFLLVQVVLLLDFVHGWNDKWVGYDEQFWLVYLLQHGSSLLTSRPVFYLLFAICTTLSLKYSLSLIFVLFLLSLSLSCIAGIWLCSLFHLYVMLQHLPSLGFSSICLPLLDMTVGSTLSLS